MMKISEAWIDRIFERMYEIYQERWLKHYATTQRMNVGKITWSAGLTGLTAEEIKAAINLCQKLVDLEPPTAVEFYHYAKGIRLPVIKRNKTDIERGDAEIAKRYISEIKMKVNSKYNT